MNSLYLWIKALHVIFMVTWFAGLFYLPRLFIYQQQTDDVATRERFTTMQTRLFAIMTIGAILTAVFGVTLVVLNTALLAVTWFQAKIVILLGLITYHYRCWCWIVRLRTISSTGDTKWLRWFNEIPTLFLFAIILLAILKPF